MILSPIQLAAMKRQMQEKALSLKMMADLMRLHEVVLKKVEEIKNFVPKEGKRGVPGETPTRQEIVNVMSPLVKTYIDNRLPDTVKSLMPEIEIPEVPTLQEIIKGVEDYIPSKSEIISEVLSKIPPTEISEPIDEESLFDSFLEFLKEKKITVDFIEGLAGRLKHLDNETRRAFQVSGGGVPSLTAGSNITLTRTSDGGYIISSTGSGGLTPITPAGVVNGVNTVFVFSSAPTIIVVDQGRIMQATSANGNINWTGTTTVTLQVAPVDDIVGFA